eukprot:14918973-Ditylum_brightwellii.AAC.1
MAPTSTQSNPDTKSVVIAFQPPQARQQERGRVDQVPAQATGSAERTKCYTWTPKLCSCQDPSQRARVRQESQADPEVLHVEEPTACGRNDHEGVSSSSIRIEQVPQGFPHPEQKQNTAN